MVLIFFVFSSWIINEYLNIILHMLSNIIHILFSNSNTLLILFEGFGIWVICQRAKTAPGSWATCPNVYLFVEGNWGSRNIYALVWCCFALRPFMGVKFTPCVWGRITDFYEVAQSYYYNYLHCKSMHA